MKSFKVLLVTCLIIGFTSTALAQRQTGSIKGKITDTEGFSLPGAFIYLTSPAMLGMQTYITSDTGKIKFTNLPPSRYKIIVEMPGFKTVNIGDIVVRVGMTVNLHILMETTTLEEEITLQIPSPMLDAESVKSSVIIDKDLLNKIPFARDLRDIISAAPGVIQESTPYPQSHIIHGSTSRSNIFAFNGANLSSMSDMQLLTNINFDLIEEIELEAAGHPAETGLIDGGYINVVTKSGGNKMSGQAIISHTNDNIASTLRAEEEISAMEVSPPVIDKKLWDISLSLGGSLMEDRLWYFTNTRLISQIRTTPFISWTDYKGNEHDEFEQDNRDFLGFFKLSGLINSNIRFSAMVNYVNRYQSIDDSSSNWNIAEEASQILDHEKNFVANGVVNYTLSQNTSIDFKANYIRNRSPLLLNEKGRGNVQYYDVCTGHLWGSAPLNENKLLKRFQSGACVTHFQDSFLWGDHELKAGAEYEYISGECKTWKENNLLINYYNGSPYYFGLSESPATGETVGKGKVSFYIAGKNEPEIGSINEMRRLSFFIQDSITALGKLTLNLGVRFDRYMAHQLAHPKEESGNPVSLKIGEELIQPITGLNPYTENTVFAWKNMMTWNAWSPRLGFSFDIFGNGKTIFKAAFSRYTEYMSLQHFTALNPFYTKRSHLFFWYDENMDEEVGVEDTFTSFPEDYRLYLEDYYKKRIDPDIQSPHTDEFTIGLQREVFQDFSFSINYIYKNKKNIFENVRYAPDLDQDWYTINQDTERWWIPFHTVVPGIDDYPDSPVTIYYYSKNAPDFFDRVKNVSELKRKYQAFEISFKKRMSNNWQLSGSVLLSKATGNIGLGYNTSSGFSYAADSPNYFVNFLEDSKLDFDRSLVIKLLGTYKFPYNIFVSFYYTHLSGTPWARNVIIIPPSSWIEENNAYVDYMHILLEKPGTRRMKAFDNLDLRIEKEFRVGDFGKLSLYVDIENAIGNKYRFISQNDGGFWFPDAENSTQGLRVISPTYKKITSLLGTRFLRISLQFSF